MRDRVLSVSLGAAALACAISLLPEPASAAPQVLAMMASDEPVPLICTDRECYGLVSTFCLQRDRDVPTYGQPYQATSPEGLTLSFIGDAGAVKQVTAAAAGLRFHGYSGYSMVRVSLPRAEMDRLGATAVALQIGPGISLVPVAAAGDRNPQTADEIALATGPLRIAASRYLDRPSVSADSARLFAALINGLPESRTIHDDHNSGLWERTIGAGLRQQTDPEALRRTERSYQNCVKYEEGSLRLCLLSHHRHVMTQENKVFWEDTGGY